MGPINRVPLGLLSLWDLKTTGRYPTDVSDVIQQSVDITPFMMAAHGELVTDNRGGLTAIGLVGFTNGFFDVPQNEVWLVEHWSVHNSTAMDPAGMMSGQVCVAYVAAPSVLSFPVGRQITANGSVGTTGAYWQAGSDAPFMVGPGGSLRFLVNELALGGAASYSCRGEARFIRLRV